MQLQTSVRCWCFGPQVALDTARSQRVDAWQVHMWYVQSLVLYSPELDPLTRQLVEEQRPVLLQQPMAACRHLYHQVTLGVVLGVVLGTQQ